jgi:hypothetical protein
MDFPQNENHWASWFLQNPRAPCSLNVKACMVKDVEPGDVLFGTDDNLRSHSLVPGFGGQTVATGQAVFTLARVGEGTVTFFGDMNAEDMTTDILCLVAKGAQ